MPASRRSAYDPARPIRFPSDKRPWLQIETPRFVLLSNTDAETSRKVADDLLRMTDAVLAANRLFSMSPGRTKILLFSRTDEAQPYFNAMRGDLVHAAGMTLRNPLGSITVIDASSRGGTTVTPRHERVHDLLHRARLPLWAEEGLAEYYSNHGRLIRAHHIRIRARLPFDLRTMFAMTPGSPGSEAADFYAMSWSLVHSLIGRDAAAFEHLLDDLGAGAEPLAAIEQHYGLAAAELPWLMQSGRSGDAVSGSDAAIAREIRVPPLDPLPVSHAAILFELGELLARIEGMENESERHFAAAFERAPADPELILRRAENLIRRPGRQEDALDCARVAQALGASEARSRAVIGIALLEAEPMIGLAQLELARALGRVRSGVAWRLWQVYMANRERELAEPLLPEVLLSDRASEARRALLDVDLARAERLAQDGRLGVAAEVLRELAVRMPPKTRASIEVQVTKLQRLDN